MGMDYSLPSLAPWVRGLDNKGGDVLLLPAGAAQSPLPVAGRAGGCVVYGAQPIAVRTERVIGFPFVGEEHLAGLNVHRAGLLGLLLGPGKDSQGHGSRDQDD